MKQILTVWERISDSEIFDRKVNAAVARGWELKKRMLVNTYAHQDGVVVRRLLYAELEKEV